MSLKNIFYPRWQAPEKVRTLITQFDTHVPNIEDESTHASYGFNVATHVGDEATKVLARRKQLEEIICSSRTTWLNQVHGKDCLNLDEMLIKQNQEGAVFEYDACFSFSEGKVCVVTTADCLPILLSDVQGNFVCAIHAGWQGLHKDIIKNTLNQIRTTASQREISLSPLCAYIAPGISQENYQVDEVFYERFIQKDAYYEKCFKPDAEGKFLADLKAMALMQLKAEGVCHIEDSGICTYEHTNFYSHRRSTHQASNHCGRFASMIWLADQS